MSSHSCSSQSQLRNAVAASMELRLAGTEVDCMQALDAYASGEGSAPIDGRLVAIYEAVKATPEYARIDNHSVIIDDVRIGGLRASATAVWLWQFAVHHQDENKAVDCLLKFASSGEISCLSTLILGGLAVPTAVQIAGNLNIYPWRDRIRPEVLGGFYDNLSDEHAYIDICQPSAVWTLQRTRKLLFVSPQSADGMSMNDISIFYAQDFEAAVALSTISECFAVAYPIFYWVRPILTPPAFGYWSLPFERRARAATLANGMQLSDLESLILKYRTATNGLSKESSKQFAMPLQRLHKSMTSARTAADAAIEMRIALETMFLSPADAARGNKKRRVSSRASRYLESEPGPRKTLKDAVGQAYEALSIAVHTGAIEDSQASKSAMQTCLAVLGKSMRKILAEGKRPDWQELDAQSSPASD